MNGPANEAALSTSSAVEIILEEQPADDGFRMTKQAFRLEGGSLVAVGPRTESWRLASLREREDLLGE